MSTVNINSDDKELNGAPMADVAISNKPGVFQLTVKYDPKVRYHRPVNAKTGKMYRELIAQVGSRFGHLNLGNGMFCEFSLSRGDAATATSSQSAVTVSDK